MSTSKNPADTQTKLNSKSKANPTNFRDFSREKQKELSLRAVAKKQEIKACKDANKKLDNYFANNELPTLAGLCIALGFGDIEEFVKEAKNRENPAYRALNTAFLRYQEALEKVGMSGKAQQWVVFASKNCGMKDETKLDVKAEVSSTVDNAIAEVITSIIDKGIDGTSETDVQQA